MFKEEKLLGAYGSIKLLVVLIPSEASLLGSYTAFFSLSLYMVFPHVSVS